MPISIKYITKCIIPYYCTVLLSSKGDYAYKNPIQCELTAIGLTGQTCVQTGIINTYTGSQSHAQG